MLSNQTEAAEFSSRWADPNSAANNGYLSGVLTGGMIDRSSSKMAQKKQQKQDQDSESSRGGRGGRGGGRGGRGGGGGRGDSSSGGGGMMESHRERKPVQEDWSMSNVMSSPVKSLVAAPRAAVNALVSKPRQARKKALKPVSARSPCREILSQVCAWRLTCFSHCTGRTIPDGRQHAVTRVDQRVCAIRLRETLSTTCVR